MERKTNSLELPAHAPLEHQFVHFVTKKLKFLISESQQKEFLKSLPYS